MNDNNKFNVKNNFTTIYSFETLVEKIYRLETVIINFSAISCRQEVDLSMTKIAVITCVHIEQK